MSEVVVLLTNKKNGFTSVSVDGRYCGDIEDPEGETLIVIKNLIKELRIDNTIVKVK